MSLCVPNQLFLTLLLIFVVVSTRRLHNRLYPRSSSHCSPRAIATVTDPKHNPHPKRDRNLALASATFGLYHVCLHALHVRAGACAHDCVCVAVRR